MSDATMRLRNMRPRAGQSLAELMIEVANEADAAVSALRRLHKVGLQYFPAEGEAFEAMEDANAALAKTGDAEAIAANREIARCVV